MSAWNVAGFNVRDASRDRRSSGSGSREVLDTFWLVVGDGGRLSLVALPSPPPAARARRAASQPRQGLFLEPRPLRLTTHAPPRACMQKSPRPPAHHLRPPSTNLFAAVTPSPARLATHKPQTPARHSYSSTPLVKVHGAVTGHVKPRYLPDTCRPTVILCQTFVSYAGAASACPRLIPTQHSHKFLPSYTPTPLYLVLCHSTLPSSTEPWNFGTTT